MNKNNDFITMTRNLVLITFGAILTLGCALFVTETTKTVDGEILTREFIQDYSDGAEVYGWYNGDGKLIEVELLGMKETKYKIK